MSAYSNTAKRFDAAFSRQTFHKSIQSIHSHKKTSDQIRGFLDHRILAISCEVCLINAEMKCTSKLVWRVEP